jgi:hypothetical protein
MPAILSLSFQETGLGSPPSGRSKLILGAGCDCVRRRSRQSARLRPIRPAVQRKPGRVSWLCLAQRSLAMWIPEPFGILRDTRTKVCSASSGPRSTFCKLRKLMAATARSSCGKIAHQPIRSGANPILATLRHATLPLWINCGQQRVTATLFQDYGRNTGQFTACCGKHGQKMTSSHISNRAARLWISPAALSINQPSAPKAPTG